MVPEAATQDVGRPAQTGAGTGLDPCHAIA